MSTSAPRKRILWVNDPFATDAEYIERMKSEYDIVQIEQVNDKSKEAEQMVEVVKQHGQFDAIAWFFSFKVYSFWPHINAQSGILDPLVKDAGEGRRLKFITCGGAGYNTVDIGYLSELGITYANNPTAPCVRTADTCVAMIGSAMRAFWMQDKHLREGKWVNHSLPAMDARESVLGVVGMGAIGKRVATTMSYLGMKIIYTKRSPLATEENPEGWEHVGLDELLKRADVVTVHVPLTEQTRQLIGAREFALMKPTSIFINTSRGPVVHEQALVDALNLGQISRAALDVYENEPEVNEGLVKSEKVLLLPHIGPYNESLMKAQQHEMLANLESWFKTGRAVTPVNGPFV